MKVKQELGLEKELGRVLPRRPAGRERRQQQRKTAQIPAVEGLRASHTNNAEDHFGITACHPDYKTVLAPFVVLHAYWRPFS